MKRVICIWLPTWPTDLYRMRVGASAPKEALALVGRLGSLRLLMAVDEKARQLGLYPGQRLASAQALVPQLTIADADPKGEDRDLNRLALSLIKAYSPLVAISSPDTIWLDVQGCAHLFGGEQAMLKKLFQHLTSKNIAARLAIADTPGCAYACARYGQGNTLYVPPAHQRERLKLLPLAALRLHEDTRLGLERLGFLCIGDLYETPRAPLTRRFGKEPLERLDQALGLGAEPLPYLEPREKVHVTSGFEEPVTNTAYVQHALERLLIRLCKTLETQNLGARRLDLFFFRADGTLQALRVGTASASRQPKHLFRLFHEHWDKIDYGFGLEALTLQAALTEPWHPHQETNALVEKSSPDLSKLIDILCNRLGEQHVFRTTALERDVPERSVKRIAALKTDPINHALSLWPSLWPRPARLLPHPEKVEAMALLPDHAPLQFTWRRQRHRIKRADGPERIFGEWWKDNRETLAVRDYFQVEDEDGARFWLFRKGDGVDPRTGSHEWFLHGFFG